MKQLVRLLAGALLVLPFVGISGLAVAQENAPDSKQQLVGTWRVISTESQNIETKNIIRSNDKIGYVYFSPGGHHVGFTAVDNLPKPVKLPYTDAERAAIHSGIYYGMAGTYTVKGNTYTVHILTSYRSENIGTDATRQFEINGKILTIKNNTVGTHSGQKIVFTTTYERVE